MSSCFTAVLFRNIKVQCVLSLALAILSSTPINAQDYQVLHSFTGSPNSGYSAKANITIDGSTLYGMTQGGGRANLGTIFKIGTDGNDYELLHSFVGGANDGRHPTASLTLIDSTLFGTTSGGGSEDCGTCFRIGTDGSNFGLLHTFTENGEGKYPESDLTFGDSTFYGMTRADSNIFKMGMDGSDFTTLRFLQIPDGVVPRGSLLLNDSTLYGMALTGGTHLGGSIFKINTDGSDFKVLHSFAISDGTNPEASLTLVGSTLYGMTAQAGPNNPCGTIFKVDTDGTDFSVLHSFVGGDDDGFWPRGSLTLVGSDLYGTTIRGGSADLGTIFKIGLDGNDFSVEHSFLGDENGGSPWGDLTLSGSTLYGMTSNGGTSNAGVIFKISVPEPSTTTLLIVGVIGLLGTLRRRRTLSNH